jgi:hypothetical protein
MTEIDTRAPRSEAGSRPSPSLRSRFDLLFDLVLLLSFSVAYAVNFTGLAIHEWFGLAFGLALLTHLTLHWDWVVRTTRRMFSRVGRRRLMWVVNALLLIDMALCVASGIAISQVAMPALGIHMTADTIGYWRELHDRTSSLAIVLIALHIGLDYRWIANVTRRWLRRAKQ